MELRFLGLFEDTFTTNFMQAADVFEKGKIVGSNKEIVITVDDDTEITEEYLTKLMETLWYASTMKEVSLVFLHDLEARVSPLFSTEVRMVSDGTKFYMFHKFLKLFEDTLDVETDESYYIKSIKLIAQ